MNATPDLALARSQQRAEETSGPDTLTAAISSAGLALGLVDLDDSTIAAISEPWLTELGLSATDVIGRPAIDMIRSDKDAAAQALAAMRDRAISSYVAERKLDVRSDGERVATLWLRAFDLDERHLALVQAATGSDDEASPITRRLGRQPARLAIGMIDETCTITALSSDVTRVLGVSPQTLIGKVLLDVVAQEDVAPLLAVRDGGPQRAVAVPIHLRDTADHWVLVDCVLTSLVGTPDRCFILAAGGERDATASRAAELEQHLWNIAAIVEASGVLQRVGSMRDLATLRDLNTLTTRQWEILARIARGERVPAIAADLHLSQSTVRNHLSAIFRRFGVNSQPELLRMINLNQPTTPT